MTESAVLQTTSDANNLVSIREFVHQAGTSFGCNHQPLSEVILAMNEAVTNIIVHGYNGQSGKISIALKLVDEDLIIQIRDWAPSFDPTKVPEPDITLPLERRKYGGMGVHMIRKLVDKFSYRWDEADGSNELILVKKDILRRDSG